MSKLAVLGGEPLCTEPLDPTQHWPRVHPKDAESLIATLNERGWGGFPEPMPRASRLADAFSQRHDTRFGMCCVNGSVSLEVAMVALDIRAGDEVIVPTYTWIATGSAPIHLNGVPVFADVDPDTYCIDPRAVEAAITPRTVGIIPVHLGSLVADLDALREIASKHGLWILEDAAHAHGAKWKDRGIGSWGEIGSFSFQTSKLMTSGEGGILTTNDASLAAKCHTIINCGRKEPPYDQFEGFPLGVNARMTEFQAALLYNQLEDLDNLHKARGEGLAYVEEHLSELGLRRLKRDPRLTERSSYQLIMRFDPDAFHGIHRDTFIAAAAAEGVPFDGDFYVPMHENPIFGARSDQWPMLRERYGDGIRAPETLQKLSFPVAERAAYEEAVWIDHRLLLGGPDHWRRIVDVAAKIRENAAELATHPDVIKDA